MRDCTDGQPPNQRGRTLRLPDAPHITCGRYESTCAASHVHHYFEIVYIESGAGLHGINHIFTPATAGDVFLITPGAVHDPSGLAAACKWVIAFSLDALDPVKTDAEAFTGASRHTPLLAAFFRGTDAPSLPLPLPTATCAGWDGILQRLLHELREQPPGFAEAARALLVLLLTDLARLAPRTSPETAATHSLLAVVFQFIESHYHEAIGLRDVAAALGYSAAYLTDLVRRKTGRTIVAWITERRMAEARYRLSETADSIQTIAYAVGYRQAPYFTRQFLHLHGMAPRAWRQMQSG